MEPLTYHVVKVYNVPFDSIDYISADCRLTF